MATNAERADAQLEEVARYRVIHRPGSGTTLLLSFRNSEQVEMVSQEQADFILGLLGKTRTLNYDGVSKSFEWRTFPKHSGLFLPRASIIGLVMSRNVVTAASQ